MIALENLMSVDEALAEWLMKFELLYNPENEGGGLVVEENSRNGPVRRVRGVTVTSFNPDFNRVSLCPMRDANPFFHFFESLWILAGRQDVEFLAEFNPRMREFSDDGTTLPAGYGMRYGAYLDSVVADILKNKNTRRAVIAGWDTTRDLCNFAAKDVPCNIAAHFEVNQRAGEIDLTVFNRSNDLIWGLLGANVVQFAFMLDYVAGACGLKRGRQTHVSSNTHLYTELPGQKHIVDRLRRRGVWGGTPQPTMVRKLPLCGKYDSGFFMAELRHWLENPSRRPGTEFLGSVAYPMWELWEGYKEDASDSEILTLSRMVSDPMWSMAAYAWIIRRRTGEI